MEAKRAHSFACDRCRSGKRKCDAQKPECGLCKKLNKACVYSTEARPRKRKYWDEDYVRNLENQVQCLLSALKATGHDGLAAPNNTTTTTTTTATPQDGLLATNVSRFSTAGGVEAEADEPAAAAALLLGGGHHAPPEPVDSPGAAARAQLVQERSEAAMEELSVMMWRTNMGDGVTIISDDSTGSDHKVERTPSHAALYPVPAPATVLSYCANPALLHELAQSFLDNINAEHAFTGYATTDFLASYPNQRCDLAFLHSAILASGAMFSHVPEHEDMGDEFARFAESLIFTCFRESPTTAVIRGLCILSERALALGRDHFGWTFISMAAGMSVHLRLHVLALDECAARSFKPSRDDIRAFWMFYMTDRTAISILGRNCVLPWRRVNVPNFDTTFDNATADIGDLSFSWQCKLWYLHDNYMDQIFSSSFETMPHSQQVQLLVSTHEALRTFYQSRDGRLDITPNTGVSKHVLFFHMAYQMAQLVTLPPFLRCFTSSNTSPASPSPGRPRAASLPDEEKVTVLILRSLTGAASTMIRLVRMYRDVVGWYYNPHQALPTTAPSSSTSPPQPSPPTTTSPPRPGKPNPVIVHYLHAAAIVQLMNATSGSPSLRKSSARQLRTCMELLAQLRGPWRPRIDKSIKVIRVLAARWGVLGALPMHYSYRVEPAEQADVGMSGIPDTTGLGQEVPKAAGGIPVGGGGGGGPFPPPSYSSVGGGMDAAPPPMGAGMLGSGWGSSTMFGGGGMSDASPPTGGPAASSYDGTEFQFLGPNMAMNLDVFDAMAAGGTYLDWMHEFDALNEYDWAPHDVDEGPNNTF